MRLVIKGFAESETPRVVELAQYEDGINLMIDGDIVAHLGNNKKLKFNQQRTARYFDKIELRGASNYRRILYTFRD